ncbi:MAG: hypothetical protein JWQ21_282 [Herminiimonas sp.]|nr:hypothetical protein [Herminiimonas sp.]
MIRIEHEARERRIEIQRMPRDRNRRARQAGRQHDVTQLARLHIDQDRLHLAYDLAACGHYRATVQQLGGSRIPRKNAGKSSCAGPWRTVTRSAVKSLRHASFHFRLIIRLAGQRRRSAATTCATWRRYRSTLYGVRRPHPLLRRRSRAPMTARPPGKSSMPRRWPRRGRD